MNRILIAVIALFLAVTSIPVSHAAVGQIDGRGAFLSTRADNVKALVKEISSNPTVAARYARHFGATPAYLTNYFGNKLTLITLKKPRVVTSYFVTSGGKIVQGRRLLPAGNRVFATRDGQLVLDWRCGNPLTSRLPGIAVPRRTAELKLPKPKTTATKGSSSKITKVAAAPTPVNPAAQPSVTEPPTIQVAGVEPMEIGQIPTVAGTVPTADATTAMPVVVTTPAPMPVATPVVPYVQPTIDATVATTATTLPPAVISSGGHSLAWLAPLLVGGGIGVFSNRDDSTQPGPEPAPVPEPTAFAVLAAGLSVTGFGLKVLRKK